MNFFRDKPLKKESYGGSTSWSNLRDTDYNENDRDFIVDDNDAGGSSESNSNDSEDSSELENLDKQDYKRKRIGRKRVTRRGGSGSSSLWNND